MLFTPHPAEHLAKLRLTMNNSPHEQKHKNTRSNIRQQTHFLKTQTKHKRQSEEYHNITKNSPLHTGGGRGGIQGSTAKHIHCHLQKTSIIRKYYLITNFIRHKHKYTTNSTKYSAAHNHRMDTRHKHATSA